MQDSTNEQATYNKKVPWLAHAIVSVIILAVAFGVISMMFSSKPEAKRWGGSRPAPSVAVEVTNLQAENYEIWIESYGTAEPLTQTNLVSDVSGRVISVEPKIRAGEAFREGDLLVKIDDRDFKIQLDIAESDAADANLRYLQEVAEAELAAQQWNKPPESEAARLLALREPQVAAAKAALNAAQARVEQAKLNLARTEIRAPFDGKVLRQMVDVGQVVSPSQSIAEIYSTDAIEVRLPIKIADLENLVLPESLDAQAESNLIAAAPSVRFSSKIGGKNYLWDGQIVRSEGAFDPATRMLYVVASINNPFIANEKRPAIRVGQFLQAEVQGQTLNDVYVIPRRAVSQDNVISIASEGFLKKHAIDPLWTDSRNVIVSASSSDADGTQLLSQNDKLILTPTANIVNGTRVKALGEADEMPSRGRPERVSQAEEKSKEASIKQTDSSEKIAANNKTASSANVSASQP